MFNLKNLIFGEPFPTKNEVSEIARKYRISEENAKELLIELHQKIEAQFLDPQVYIKMSDGTMFDADNGWLIGQKQLAGGKMEYVPTKDKYKYFDYFDRELTKRWHKSQK